MMVRLKIEKTVWMEPQMRADTRGNAEHLTLRDIIALMDHDSYRRVKGRVRQKNWVQNR